MTAVRYAQRTGLTVEGGGFHGSLFGVTPVLYTAPQAGVNAAFGNALPALLLVIPCDATLPPHPTAPAPR